MSRLRLCVRGCFSLQGSRAIDVVASEDLLGKLPVTLRSAGSWIIEGDRLAIAWGLREPNVPWNRGLEQLGTKKTAQVLRDLLSQVSALVIHSEDHTLNVERRV